MIDTELRGDVLEITINRPDKANALTLEGLEELLRAIGNADDIGTIVITGAGGRFSAGADLNALTGTADDARFEHALAEVTELITSVGTPVISAVEGHALGAGFDVAFSCDVVVAAAGAKVAVPATALGILYNPDAIRRLHARLGSAVLRQLLVANMTLDAGDLADVVTEPGEALATAREIAKGATVGLTKAVAATKRVLDDLDNAAGGHWQTLRRQVLEAPERAEALQRFRDARQAP